MCSHCLRPRSDTGPLLHSPLATLCRSCAERATAIFADLDSSESEPFDPEKPAWSNLDDAALLQRVRDVADAGGQVEEHLRAWVTMARERGISWSRIGASLDMTRQSAWERFSTSKSRA